MTIGITGPIAIGAFKEWLGYEDAVLIEQYSDANAPSVTTLALEFLKMGHDVVIFAQNNNALRPLTLRGEHLTIHIAPKNSKAYKLMRPYLSTYLNVRRMMREHKGKIDVISAHWTRDFAMASMSFTKRDVPVFVTVRDIIPYVFSQMSAKGKLGWAHIYLKNEYVMHQKAFHFIANSAYTAREVKRYWNVEAPIIPNSVADMFFDGEPETETWQTDRLILCSISISSINERRKNIINLLKAFKMLRTAHPNAELRLIGPAFDDRHPDVISLRSEGMLEGVKLMGRMQREQLKQQYRECNIMVHPSLEETFGNTLIEAMASGCPVVGGRDSGAVPYVLDHGRAGYLCDVESPEAITETIEQMIANPRKVTEKMHYARRFCEDKFSSRSVAKAYIEEFQKALNATK